MEVEDENPFLVEFLLKKGIVKDIRQADVALGVFIAVTILLSIFIFYFFSSSRKVNLTPQESNFLNSQGGKRTPKQYDANLFPS